MVIVILSDQMGYPEIEMEHYNLPPREAREKFVKDHGYTPKFGFMRLSQPSRTSIVTDLKYTLTSYSAPPSDN